MKRKDDGSIELYGYKDDVIREREIINQKIINYCEETNKNFKKIIKTPAKNFQWEYESQSNWVAFSLYLNAVIEDAYENKKKTVNLKKDYICDFKNVFNFYFLFPKRFLFWMKMVKMQWFSSIIPYILPINQVIIFVEVSNLHVSFTKQR